VTETAESEEPRIKYAAGSSVGENGNNFNNSTDSVHADANLV